MSCIPAFCKHGLPHIEDDVKADVLPDAIKLLRQHAKQSNIVFAHGLLLAGNRCLAHGPLSATYLTLIVRHFVVLFKTSPAAGCRCFAIAIAALLIRDAAILSNFDRLAVANLAMPVRRRM